MSFTIYPIPIGINKGKQIYFEFPRNEKNTTIYGLGVILGKPGSGKSAWLKDLTVKLLNIHIRQLKSKVIIFDIGNEWKCIEEYNFSSKYYRYRAKFIKSIDSPKFFPYEFNQLLDWERLEFTTDASATMIKLLEKEELKKNIPLLTKCIGSLPVVEKDRLEFENEWGFDMKPVHRETKRNMITKWEICKNWFTDKEDSQHILNWARYVSDPNVDAIRINFNMTPGTIRIAQTFAGKILLRIIPALKNINPLIIIEEADYLCQQPKEGKPMPLSTSMLYQYVMKYRSRGGGFIFLCTQTGYSLFQDILHFATVWIFCLVPQREYLLAGLEKFEFPQQHFNLAIGQREFFLVDRFRNDNCLFTPYESCCKV